MKIKLLLITALIPLLSLSQTQIGQDIDGEEEDDRSGFSVSLSSDGNIVAIGAPNNEENGISYAGQVRIYENQSYAWVQIGQDIDGDTANDYLGWLVSLSNDGNIVAIGSRGIGYVRIYENQSGTWVQIGQDIDGDTANNYLGGSLSLSGDGNIVAIGGLNGVRIYENQSGTWAQIGQEISGSRLSLSDDGTIVAIGGANGVRIYENQSGFWVQIGQDINGDTANDYFGWSVSLSDDGTTVAIGSPNNGGNGQESGRVQVYENQSGAWVQIGQDIYGWAIQVNLGHRLSLSGDGSIVAITAPYHINGQRGYVLIYKNELGTWVQKGQTLSAEWVYDRFGESLSLSNDGSILAVGAPYNNNVNGSDSGHVRVYDLSLVLSSDDIVLSQFNLYPNPTKNQFTIQLNDGFILEKVNIYNSLGQFISTSKEKVIKTLSFSSGIFYVEIITDKGKATKKLIIE